MSNRTISKFKHCKNAVDTTFAVSLYSLFIYVFCVGFQAYEYFKNRNDPDPFTRSFADSNIFFFWLSLFYASTFVFQSVSFCKAVKVIPGVYVGKTKVFNTGGEFPGTGWIVFRTVIAFFGLRIIIIFTSFFKTTRFAISDTELYLFYFTAACVEESFFRGFMQQNTYDAFYISVFKSNYKPVAAAIAIFTSSFAFGASHWIAYQGDSTLLWSAVFAGALLGGIYLWSDGNLIEVMFAHGLSNVMSVYSDLKDQTTQTIVPNGTGLVALFILSAILLCTIAVKLFKRSKAKKNATVVSLFDALNART